MEITLAGKRALITGGSGGIGGAITEAMAEAGAKVYLGYYGSKDAAEKIASRIRERGGEAITAQADVSKPGEVGAMFAKMDAEFGGIDILVNCAGIDGDYALSWEAEAAAFEKVVMVNLMGTYFCSREALRRMVPEKSGVILNISSVHEVIPWTGFAAYTTAKAGIAMMTKTMAQEASPHGVRLIDLAPGAIRTPINKDVWSDPEKMSDLKTKIPMNRIGEPEEVAKIALVLCSDAASYVTGSTVFVDGGMVDYPSFAHGG